MQSWSEDRTTTKWSPAHVREVHWPKRQTPSAAGLPRAVPARPQARITQAIQLSETQTAWLYGVTAVIALGLALAAARALLPVLIGEGEARELSGVGLARAQPSAAPLRAPRTAAVLPAPVEPRAAAARARQRARSHRRAHKASHSYDEQPQQEEDLGAVADPNLVPDMDFMNAPVSERELRIMAGARATSAAAEPPQTGTLRINSRPWSHLYLDGRLVGSTPQVALSVSAGAHRVRLVNPQFAMSKTFSVVVGAGESVTRVETLE